MQRNLWILEPQQSEKRCLSWGGSWNGSALTRQQGFVWVDEQKGSSSGNAEYCCEKSQKRTPPPNPSTHWHIRQSRFSIIELELSAWKHRHLIPSEPPLSSFGSAQTTLPLAPLAHGAFKTSGGYWASLACNCNPGEKRWFVRCCHKRWGVVAEQEGQAVKDTKFYVTPANNTCLTRPGC